MTKAMAISAIWIGVGLSAMAGEVVSFVSFMGMIATMFVVARF